MCASVYRSRQDKHIITALKKTPPKKRLDISSRKSPTLFLWHPCNRHLKERGRQTKYNLAKKYKCQNGQHVTQQMQVTRSDAGDENGKSVLLPWKMSHGWGLKRRRGKENV